VSGPALREKVGRALHRVRLGLEAPRREWSARQAPAGCIHVIVPPRLIQTYEELSRGLVDVLRACGHPAVLRVTRDLDHLDHVRPGDRLLVFGVYRFTPPAPRDGVLLCGVQTEQYPPGWTSTDSTSDELIQQSDRFLARCDRIFESNECLALEAERLGRRPDGVLPFAYTPRFLLPPPRRLTPTHDIAFLGRLAGGRRAAAIERLSARYRMLPALRAWGGHRRHFLHAAHIQLDIHQWDKRGLAGHRFALVLANGGFLLSEPLPTGAPFEAGVHYAAADLADFDAAIEYYLAHPQVRQRIARAGQAFFREHYKFERFVSPFLESIARCRSSGGIA
jgi:hypothetical protein